MEHQEQREKEAEEAINAINKRTGRNMPQAIATAAVLVILILACLLISIDLFVYLVVLFMLLALWELRVDFATAGLHIPVVMLWICSTATLLATFYSDRHIVAMTICVLVSLLLVAMAASAKVTFGSRISLAVANKLSHTDAGARLESSFNHEQGEISHSRLSHVAVSMFTVLYIPLLASCLIMPLTFNDHPVAHAIMLVFMPALSDTGGLFAGAWLGKHKLSPRISPKKSWEGLMGSLIAAVATGAGCVWAIGGPWWAGAALGACTVIVSTLGDLGESLLKRDLGLKDMGTLLPGHGGIMDRLDSILVAAPLVYAFTLLVK